MRIIFAGAGEFGLPTLRALDAGGHEIVQIITQPDRPAGRGRHLSPTPIGQFAIQSNRPLTRTTNINSEKLPEADLMVVIAFGQKISSEQANHARLGAVNLHGSRLPKFRGAGPVNAAILAGETFTGNSVIRLADKMDAGAILGQSSLEIGELETAGELHDRLALDGAGLMLDVIAQLQAGRAIELPQDDALACRAPKLSRASSAIDWNNPADAIARQIRGMYPWPGCHLALIDETGVQRARVTLVRARPASQTGPCGIILADGSVGAATGSVEIVEIQPEGKRPMPLVAFCNGHPWKAGMRLESLVK